MGTLRKHDVAVFPAWMCKGKHARDQVVITYLFMLAGEEWTFKQLSELCGCGVNSDYLKRLAEEGVLVETNAATRKNQKPCYKYVVNADFIPDRPEEVAEKPKVAIKYKGWVFACLNAWKATQGILSPLVIHNALKPAVAEYGERAVVKAFEVYAGRAEKRYASPKNFVGHINSWIKTTPERQSSPSLREMYEG